MKKFILIASLIVQPIMASVALANQVPQDKVVLQSEVAAVSREVVKSIGTGAKQVMDTTISGVNALTTEAINLFIFKSLIEILGYSVVFIIFFIVKKYIDFLQLAGFDEKKSKALKTSALILSLTFFSMKTMPHLQSITEALVAPNIFVMKKGAEYIKEIKGN